jgi:hypothetical protein
MMEAVSASETMVNLCSIPEDCYLHIRHCANLKSHVWNVVCDRYNTHIKFNSSRMTYLYKPLSLQNDLFLTFLFLKCIVWMVYDFLYTVGCIVFLDSLWQFHCLKGEKNGNNTDKHKVSKTFSIPVLRECIYKMFLLFCMKWIHCWLSILVHKEKESHTSNITLIKNGSLYEKYVHNIKYLSCLRNNICI